VIEKFCQSVVYPIPPSFQRDQRLDLDSVVNYITHLRLNGAKVFLTTAGTSRFNLLSDEEIIRLNRCVFDTVKVLGGVFIMGLPPVASWHLSAHLAQAETLKPDAILAMYPDRYYNDDAIINYYKHLVCATSVPTMMHGMSMRNATGGTYNYSTDLVKKLKDIGVIGMKEECTEYHLAYLMSRLADESFLVFPAGGSGRRFLLTHPAGAQNYLAGIGNLFPRWEELFYSHMKAGEISSASRLIREFEDPLMECFGKIGWHLALQTALQQLGTLPTYNREPFAVATDAQVQAVVDIIQSLNQKWTCET